MIEDGWNSSISSDISSVNSSQQYRYTLPLQHYGWIVLSRRGYCRLSRRRFARLEGSLLTIHANNKDDSSILKQYDMLDVEICMIEQGWKIELWSKKSGKKVGILSMLRDDGKDDCELEKIWYDWGECLRKAGKLKLEEYYVVGNRIGVGHYGAVYEGYDKHTGEKVAIKIVERRKERLTKKERVVYVKREREIVELIGAHENIIRTLDVFDESKRLVLVMEYADEGNVLQWVKGRKSSEKRAQEIALQVISAVAWLHGMLVIHRDIKPENLLVRKGVIKLCDFGLSRALYGICNTKGYDLKSVCGTPVYVAPEVARKEKYSFPVDMWSCGVLIYVLMSGRLPFAGHSIGEVLKNVAACNGAVNFPMEKWSHVSSTAKDFIQKLLAPNPADRLTANEALGHPWLKTCSLAQSKSQLAMFKARVMSGGSYRTMSRGNSGECAMRNSSSCRAFRSISSTSGRKRNASPTTLRYEWSPNQSQSMRFSGWRQVRNNSFERQLSDVSGTAPVYRRDSSPVFHCQTSNNSMKELSSPAANDGSYYNPRCHFGRSPSGKDTRTVRLKSNRSRFKLKFLRTSERDRSADTYV